MKDNKTRNKILEVAEEEFMSKGFAGARTTEIAKRAGVNHAMLHYYFNTKEQLFECVSEVIFGKLQQSMMAAFQVEEMPVVEKVVEMVVRHFEFLYQNPDLPRFILNEAAVRPEWVGKIKEGVLPMMNDAIAGLQRDLDAAAGKGEIQRTDAATLVMYILSANVSAFVFAPVLCSVEPDMDLQAYYGARCQENVQLILNRINPNAV